MAKTARRAHNAPATAGANGKSSKGKHKRSMAMTTIADQMPKIFGNSLWKLSFWSDFFFRCLSLYWILRWCDMEVFGCCCCCWCFFFLLWPFVSRINLLRATRSIFHHRKQIECASDNVKTIGRKKKPNLRNARVQILSAISEEKKQQQHQNPEKREETKYDEPTPNAWGKTQFSAAWSCCTLLAICRLFIRLGCSGVAHHSDYLLIYFNLCDMWSLVFGQCRRIPQRRGMDGRPCTSDTFHALIRALAFFGWH